jgi:hypothetical protein
MGDKSPNQFAVYPAARLQAMALSTVSLAVQVGAIVVLAISSFVTAVMVGGARRDAARPPRGVDTATGPV